MNATYDLIIIGGGPAGTSAAISGTRAGARVLLLERGRFPRHKVCGEFVSAESLGLLTELLDREHTALLQDAVRISQARVFLDGRVLQTVVDPPAASIARLDLDAALWHSAEQRWRGCAAASHGSEYCRNRPVPNRHHRGEFEGKSLVNASGRWSNLKIPPSPGNHEGIHEVARKKSGSASRRTSRRKLQTFDRRLPPSICIFSMADIVVCSRFRSEAKNRSGG